MRPAKSANSLAGNRGEPFSQQVTTNSSKIPPKRQEGDESSSNSTQNNINTNNASKNHPTTSPICRCRVMYLGSSVPHITKDGLQGIQEPLRELYPDKATLASGNAGIDSWLSVWSNGILIENVDDSGREVKRFFKIDALHYCAAVKYVQLSAKSQNFNPYTTLPNPASLANFPKFLPLDSPHARQTNQNPPIFASILRRTTGIKVLECHAFICKREAAANALVRCCFHAYADTMYAKQIGAEITAITHQDINNNDTNQRNMQQLKTSSYGDVVNVRKAKSVMALNEESKRFEPWRAQEMHYAKSNLTYRDQMDAGNQMVRRKSINQEHISNGQQYGNENLLKQQQLSKSMHHLNQNGANFHESINYQKNSSDDYEDHQSISASCMNQPTDRHPDSWLIQQVNQQSYFNPYTSRVPSYPPQNLIEPQNNGGTMRSIKSLAANSIASTLLRSKKHAKAMSMAHLNNQEKMMTNQSGPNTMIPVPPMFLPNIPMRIINGSQTMKPIGRPSIPLVGPPSGFETMTPKEIKKLLKKSSKYGLDPSKFPFLQPGHQAMIPPFPPPPPPGSHQSKSATMVSHSNLSEVYDLHPVGLPMPNPMCDQPKPILMKPNSEFLKSKAGKKWVKQQKQFKKLLPPHLDGLPIIFGPPPIEALEAANVPGNMTMPMPTLVPPQSNGMPMMDAAGFYNPNPFYGQQNGTASSASTLLRYSPRSQLMTEQLHQNGGDMMNGGSYEPAYQGKRNSMGFSNEIMMDQQAMSHGRKGYTSDDSSIMNGGGQYGVHGRPPLPAHASHLGYLPGRNQHMVEQSVISLGDENDYDDEQDISNGQYQDYAPNQNGGNPLDQRRANGSKSSSNYQQINGPTYESPQQMAYNQQMSEQLADDQSSSYSSGLGKREHISERAFSYSIRQEQHRSNGRKDPGDYAARSEHPSAISNGNGAREHRPGQDERHLAQTRAHNQNFHQQFVEPGSDRRNGGYYATSKPATNPQNIQMDELSARLENQLNMKSFADGR